MTAAVSGRALLSALWVALMLVYLLSDVLIGVRIAINAVTVWQVWTITG